MSSPSSRFRKRAMLFFASQCISLFGSQISQMAIVWYVTLHTNSGAWVAAFSLCAYLPQFFISFPGGAWADRFSRKRLIILADALIAAVTLLTLLVMPHIASESLLLAALLLMSILRSAGSGVQTPAVSAVVPTLVPDAERMRYNGVNAAMQSAVQFAAPAAAAIILSAGSLREALAIDILTAAAGISLLACLRLPRQERTQHTPSVFSDMRSGVRYAQAIPSVRSLLIIYGLFVFLTVPAGYLSGLLVRRVYGDTYWHLTAVELAGFGGMTAGGLLMSLWGGFKNRRTTLAYSLFLFGAAAIGMCLVHAFALYLVFMAVYGVSLTVVQTTLTTMLQKKAEPAMHGRIFGLMSSLYAGCYPAGMAFFGPMADWIALPWIMVFSGAALMFLAGMVSRGPALSGD